MTDETESDPWVSWPIKGIVIIFLTFLQEMAVIALVMLVPWMSGSIVGLTLLISAVVFLAGNAILLESKDVRVWGYSIVAGFAIGIGGIVLSTLWMFTFISLPLVGNAFNATMIVVTIIGFTATWFWSKDNIEAQSGLIASSSKSAGGQKMISGGQLFQRKSSMIRAVELKEIAHDYTFSDDKKLVPTKFEEQFHNIVRALISIPFALRIERKNRNTRIVFLTWSTDETQVAHQQ
ncbi:unnamed protein product, partial [marine sediment metagenome]